MGQDSAGIFVYHQEMLFSNRESIAFQICQCIYLDSLYPQLAEEIPLQKKLKLPQNIFDVGMLYYLFKMDRTQLFTLTDPGKSAVLSLNEKITFV